MATPSGCQRELQDVQRVLPSFGWGGAGGGDGEPYQSALRTFGAPIVPATDGPASPALRRGLPGKERSGRARAGAQKKREPRFSLSSTDLSGNRIAA